MIQSTCRRCGESFAAARSGRVFCGIECGNAARSGRSLPRETRGAVIDGDVATITLTKGLVAVVDAVDADLGDQCNWAASGRKSSGREIFYATTSRTSPDGRQQVYMHREVAARAGVLVPGLDIDHVDGDRLNNRRANLRAATRSENNANARLRRDNTSGAKGVSWSAKDRCWYATLWVGGRCRFLGGFSDHAAAAVAYASAARDAYGQFARTEGQRAPR